MIVLKFKLAMIVNDLDLGLAEQLPVNKKCCLSVYIYISYQTSMKSQPEAPEGLWNPLVRGVGSEEDRPLCRGPPVMSRGPQ